MRDVRTRREHRDETFTIPSFLFRLAYSQFPIADNHSRRAAFLRSADLDGKLAPTALDERDLVRPRRGRVSYRRPRGRYTRDVRVQRLVRRLLTMRSTWRGRRRRDGDVDPLKARRLGLVLCCLVEGRP